MLEALAKREVVTELPIYTFRMLEIEKEDGKKAMAIVCVADPNGPGYFGDGLSPAEKARLSPDQQQDLSRRKKAYKIAEANGQSRKSGKYMTCKSYFDRFVRISIQLNPVKADADALKGLSPLRKKRTLAMAKEQERLMELAHEIRQYRASLSKIDPAKYAMLISIEKDQLQNWKKKKAHAAKRRKPTLGPKP